MSGEDVVVTGLLCRDGRALLVHRTPGRRWYPDAWDLPGGHVEPGEVPRLALERELHEELGIAATVTGAPFAHVHGRTFRMDVWLVVTWTGEPINKDADEHDALAWLTAQEMGCLRLVNPQLPQLVQAALDHRPRSATSPAAVRQVEPPT